MDGGLPSLRLVAAEAWHEFRAGCRSPVIPFVFVGNIAYQSLAEFSYQAIVRWWEDAIPFGLSGAKRK